MTRIPIHAACLAVRPIPGRTGYSAALDGRIVRHARAFVRSSGYRYAVGNAVFRGSDNGGSLCCSVGSRSDGTHSTTSAGREVLRAFVGEPPSAKHQCAHWNGDHTDNRIWNLRWATQVENEADKRRHGRRRCGERVYNAKLTEAAVRDIRRRRPGETWQALADEFGVSKRAAMNAGKGITWKDVE